MTSNLLFFIEYLQGYLWLDVLGCVSPRRCLSKILAERKLHNFLAKPNSKVKGRRSKNKLKSQSNCEIREQVCQQPNEEYSSCHNECGRTCFDFKKGSNAKCPDKCSRGCLCKQGFVRNENGQCVKEEECILTRDRIICNKNEIYSDCGSDCGHNCKDLNRKGVHCFSCESGCFCKKGFYRSSKGMCVAKQECPPKVVTSNCDGNEKCDNTCPPKEIYEECGDKCKELCEPSIDCTSKCEKGCFCDEGYHRHKSGKCVSEDECQSPEQCIECESNEYYTDCGSDCGKLCSDLGSHLKCKKDCRTGCFCKYGFFRNELGLCVTRDKCS